jgi:hypothetical protein
VHKVYLVEDGVVYFHPRSRAYGLVKPRAAQISARIDWFEAVSKRLQGFGLKLSAWTVCMHNSRLGEAYPEMVVHDAFGNRHPYALCPSHPEVRRYIRGLASDLARYPLTSILLEAFRYLDVVHGAHHERWSIPLPPLERSLLGLSFCSTDLQVAANLGIDGGHVRQVVKEHLESFFRAYPKLPRNFPRNQEEFDTLLPELVTYRGGLVSIMDSLLEEIVGDLDSKSVDLIGQGQQEFNITCSPGQKGFSALMRPGNDGPPRIARDSIRLAKRSALPGQKIYTSIRIGFDAIKSYRQLKNIVKMNVDSDVDGIIFNNYAECAETILGWVKKSRVIISHLAYSKRMAC